jgi:type VI secretion system secreted protein Hcp
MPLECAIYFDDFEGGNPKAGREGSSVVTRAEHKIYRPVDDQTGEVQGTRVHGAMKVYKELDKATPEIYRLLCTGQQTGCTVKWYWVNPEEGTEEHYFTHDMDQVKIASQTVVCPDTKDPQAEKQPHGEWVEILYETLTQTHEIDSIMHTDSWTA